MIRTPSPRVRARRAARPAIVVLAFVGLACAFAALSIDARALADRGPRTECGDAARAFAKACAGTIGAAVTPLDCTGAHGTFRLGDERSAAALSVDVAAPAGHAFREAGPFGVSPVGDFADWSAEPAARRDAFEGFARCLAGASRGILAADVRKDETAVGGVRALRPIRLVLGVALLVLAAAPLVRRRPPSWRRSRLLPLALLWLGAAALSASLVEAAYFHQNGQGPIWLDFAQGTSACWYGPGAFDVHAVLTALSPSHPERMVFLLDTLLVATIPVSAWLLARSLGARRALSWAIALGFAGEPVLMMIGRSESYFAPMTSLLFAAAATLSLGGIGLRLRSRGFLLAIAAAGLFVAQAARVHGYSWIPAAFLPPLLLLHRGPLRRRAAAACLAAAGIAVVVLVAAGPSLWSVVHAPLGAGWSRRASEVFHRRLLLQLATTRVRVALVALAACAALVAVRRVRTPALALLLAGLAFATATLSKMQLAEVQPYIDHGWASLWFPLFAACAIALLARAVPPRLHAAVAAAVLAAALAYDATAFRVLDTRGTDARESRVVDRWIDELEPNRTIHYLSVAGEHVQVLLCRSARYNKHPIRLQDLPLRPDDLEPGDCYVHTSVCSTTEGRPACEAIERATPLVEIARALLPAIPSERNLAYDTDAIPVILYRVAGPATPGARHP